MEDVIKIPSKEHKGEIKALQERLEEGDVITIWKNEFQIQLKGNVPTNYVVKKLED